MHRHWQLKVQAKPFANLINASGMPCRSSIPLYRVHASVVEEAEKRSHTRPPQEVGKNMMRLEVEDKM